MLGLVKQSTLDAANAEIERLTEVLRSGEQTQAAQAVVQRDLTDQISRRVHEVNELRAKLTVAATEKVELERSVASSMKQAVNRAEAAEEQLRISDRDRCAERDELKRQLEEAKGVLGLQLRDRDVKLDELRSQLVLLESRIVSLTTQLDLEVTAHAGTRDKHMQARRDHEAAVEVANDAAAIHGVLVTRHKDLERRFGEIEAAQLQRERDAQNRIEVVLVENAALKRQIAADRK